MLVLTDRRSGVDQEIVLDELLPIASPAPTDAAPTEFEPPAPGVMRRYVLRMTPAARAQTAGLTYREGDLVCVIGDSSVNSTLRNQLSKSGCRNADLAGPNWLAEFDRLLKNEVPRHLVLLDESGPASPSLAQFHAADRFAQSFEICRKWLESLERADAVAGASLVAVTRMGGDFGFHSSGGNFAGGGLTGLLKGIRREYPALRVKALDFDQPSESPAVARRLVEEINSGASELEVGFRSGRRYVVQAVKQPAPLDKGRDIAKGGVWVVTGGGRGVTAVVARELGRRFGLKLHLLGTALPPERHAVWRGLNDEQLRELKRETALRARDQGKNPADEWRRIEKAMELERNLLQLNFEGVRATYHTCDIRDRESLATILQQVRQNDGPIAGIVHGAGVEAACKFVRKQPESVAVTLASKCDGAANLIELTRDDPLEYFVGFGSTSGRFGGLGQADYSMASDLLAKMMGHLAAERPECHAVCFHWPAWDEVGMAVRPESKMALQHGGIAFMPPREGVAHLVDELRSRSGEREVLILDKPEPLDIDGTMTLSSAPADPAEFGEEAKTPAAALGKPSTSAAANDDPANAPNSLVDCSRMPMIHAIRPGNAPGTYLAEIPLDATKDPFLVHHRFRGKPFMPGVMTLELFAEAAALLKTPATVIGLRDIRLENGWTLDPKRNHEALVRMSETKQGVACELVGPFYAPEGKLMEKDRVYARAVVELGDAPPRIEPIDPGEPVFTWFPFYYPEDMDIFHGPPFRSFQKLNFVHGGGRAIIQGMPPNELLGDRAGDGMLIAAVALDGSLVACGAFGYAMLEKLIEIPSGIARFRQVRLPAEEEQCKLRFFLREMREDGNVYDITLVGESGDVVLDVNGYETTRVKETS